MAEHKEMSFLQHVEVLRGHLWRSSIAVFIGSVLAFIFTDFLFDTVLFGPYRSDFLTKKALCWLGQQIQVESLCLGELPMSGFQNISMSGQFTWHIWACLIAGMVLAFPYILYEIWRFVRPALHAHEQNKISGIVFFSSFLFFSGVAFGYFILAPMTVHFLGTYSVSAFIENKPTFTSYISTILQLTLGTGLVFELPVFVFFLARLGLVGPKFLRKYRRHAVVVILVVAAVVTPPDVTSQVLITIPLLLLYEISIWIAARQFPKEA
jgi:sec-independent protein translocase protein TatC